ncbi:GntR family transcriptional regulator [Rubellimicrobium sp. CFH 75288]|uniref:GntR family transcriptional regulator n=1 Tax=Rubellimicrobium sp. CFH 75288 TaxID=2697034 RepID=UPI00141357A6|nr:GntR family transcriptional regulator [Rubellimicrobium sp. CFH 75288]NAZ36579.1 UTRA domain-containing protein [Rubellimicrobium sp. CFH 75288]
MGPHDPFIARLADSLARPPDGPEAGGPLYRRLALALSEVVGEGGGGTCLPSERVLAARLGMSRVTVRRALEELAREGLLRRRQGARTRVATRVEKALSALTGFSEELRARGSVPGQRWLSRQVVRPSPTEALALGLGAADLIVRLIRVRTADGVPLAIERAAVPQAILPSGDLVGESLYAALAALGAAPVRGAQRIRAGIMARIEAELLDSEPGSPLLIVERRCFLADGRPVEFTETRYSGERYDFLTELGT